MKTHIKNTSCGQGGGGHAVIPWKCEECVEQPWRLLSGATRRRSERIEMMIGLGTSRGHIQTAATWAGILCWGAGQRDFVWWHDVNKLSNARAHATDSFSPPTAILAALGKKKKYCVQKLMFRCRCCCWVPHPCIVHSPAFVCMRTLNL